MNETTIYTNDTKNNSVYSTTDKLYLAYGDREGQGYITVVGENSKDDLNDGLRIDSSYWGETPSDAFWIRSPSADNENSVLTAYPSADTSNLSLEQIDSENNIRPAFELNISSVLFASAAPAATKTSEKDAYQLMNEAQSHDPFTLRYDAGTSLGQLEFTTRTISYSGVPEGTTLVVQNGSSASALSISGSGTVSANRMKVVSLKECMVWIEKTDTPNRKTYATRGTYIDGNAVVNEPEDLTAVYGETLSDVALPEYWSWEDATTAVETGQQAYLARFDTEAKFDGKISFGEEYDFSDVDGYARDEAENHWYVYRSLAVNVLKAGSSVTILTGSLDKTYDGQAVSEPEVKKTGSTQPVSVTWYQQEGTDWKELETAPVDAGSYKVVVSLPEDNNYNSASDEKRFTIQQAANTWTSELTINGWTYGDPAESPSAAARFGTIAYTYSDSQDGTYTDAVPTEAGTWYVKASVAGNENYTGLEARQSFDIAKATPEFEVPDQLTIVQGQPLSTVRLPDGFAWKDATQTADQLGSHTFTAIYTPEDTENYTTVEVALTVNVVAPETPADHAGNNVNTGNSTNDAAGAGLLAVALAGTAAVLLHRRRNSNR